MPGQQPKHDTYDHKISNHPHAPPDPLRSVEPFSREVLSTQLLVVRATGHASPDMVVLQVCHLQHCIRKAVDGDNVLLEPPDDENELSILAEKVQNGLEKDRMESYTRS